MKVGEIKEKLPEVDVYEFRDDMNYLIVMEPGHRQELLHRLTSVGKQVLVLEIPDPANAVKILVGEGVHHIALATEDTAPWEKTKDEDH